MTIAASAGAPGAARPVPAWNAVHAMALCVFVLIASEFLPVSLLSPIARDLRLSEGQAGQAIAISGIFAVIASLAVTLLARLDRRPVLIGLTALMALSGTLVAFAPDFPLLMVGRALLGITIGGFWGLSTATVMRLVPVPAIPRALAITNAGNAIATTIAAPLGSFAAGLIGWRGASFCVVPLAVAAALWLAMVLPSQPPVPHAARRNVPTLLRDRQILHGLVAIMLLFMGQFALFTYLRPFLERVTGVDLPTLSLLLLLLGISGFVGTMLAGSIVGAHLRRTLWAMPAILAATAAALALLGTSLWLTAVLLVVWGFVGTAAPVAWNTWLTRAAPNDAEAGGGLMVAVIRLAITAGASLGGLLYDVAGPRLEFLASAAVLLLAAGVAAGAHRAGGPLPTS